MAAKINKTVKISLQRGAGIHKAEPDVMMGGASNTGNYDGVKRRGGASPATGNGYGTARGLGGGAKTSSTDTRRTGSDSDGY